MFFVGLLFAAIAYVVGSLNCAILVCKAMKLPDPRVEGSGNPGATNVLRIGNKQAAVFVLIGDVLKGALPVLVAYLIGVEGFMLALIALAAVLGHMFPVFFEFKGGKGVATAFGAMLVLTPGVTIFGLIVWVGIVFVTRYISLASVITPVVASVLILFLHIPYFLPIAVMAGLIIWRHKDNIDRLKAGTENKFEW
jgi:glycerol-3-phosphate acyltransferase PlsY